MEGHTLQYNDYAYTHYSRGFLSVIPVNLTPSEY